jgi:hypothetical protein
MHIHGKGEKSTGKAHPIRSALGTVAEFRAEQEGIEHGVDNARQVAGAKAKAAVANAKVVIAQKKRDIEKRIDDVRAGARNRK